jgi:tRNA modification GTPase
VFSTTDTIVAIATPPGRGGIGVVRLSGPSALAVSSRLIAHEKPLEPRRATLTAVRIQADDARTSPEGGPEIDQAVVTYFPAPASYTTEDVVEISAHGSPIVLQGIVTTAIRLGARLAEPGEFTLRAYLNGRIDLVQAEAVADLIEAVTPVQARAAFDQLQGTLTRAISGLDETLFDLVTKLEASVDFPEEGYHFADPGAVATALENVIDRTEALIAGGRRGRLIREGMQVAIVGPPNAGKSSLFNALAGARRAIVTDIPGTTRDMVTETVDLLGIRVTLIDTAGLRQAADVIEQEGVRLALQAALVSDLVLMVVDRSRPFDRDVLRETLGPVAAKKTVVVANKADLPAAWCTSDAVEVSATSGDGLDVLKRRIVGQFDGSVASDRPEITNVRHLALLEDARSALVRAREAIRGDEALSEEFVLADLQDARTAFEQITGRRTPDDVLAHIFQHFCVGK